MIYLMRDVRIFSLHFFISLQTSTLHSSISRMLNSNTTPIAVEPWFIPFDLLTLVCLILTIILDCLFICIIILDKACHTARMILIANTCFTELLAAINALFMNIFTLQNDLQRLHYYDSLCLFRGYLTPSTCAMIIYSFLLQAIHRYSTVVYPARLFWQSRKTQIIFICASLLFCVLYPLAFLFTGQIIYNVDNQNCQLVVELGFPMIFVAFCAYGIPLSTTIFLYRRLVVYVKAIRNRVTPANVLFRASRELKMMQQTVIFLSILLALGMPYVIFLLISFFTTPPKYHLRIGYIFIETSFLFLVIAIFYFTDPLKASMKKILHRQTNVAVASMTWMNRNERHFYIVMCPYSLIIEIKSLVVLGVN